VTYEDVPCRQIVEMVTDYLEGALSAENVLLLERHLSICEGCTAYLDQMRITLQATGAIGNEPLPPHVLGPLLEAFRSMRG
jgi:predicted anti-sigma-YlaC factor YlaD